MCSKHDLEIPRRCPSTSRNIGSPSAKTRTCAPGTRPSSRQRPPAGPSSTSTITSSLSRLISERGRAPGTGGRLPSSGLDSLEMSRRNIIISYGMLPRWELLSYSLRAGAGYAQCNYDAKSYGVRLRRIRKIKGKEIKKENRGREGERERGREGERERGREGERERGREGERERGREGERKREKNGAQERT